MTDRTALAPSSPAHDAAPGFTHPLSEAMAMLWPGLPQAQVLLDRMIDRIEAEAAR